MKLIQIYTDGACSFNPGPGGYGAVLLFGQHRKEIAGGEDNTTNNRMELKAVIEGLKSLNEICQVEIYSDSNYVVKAFNEKWIYSWEAKGWKKKGENIINLDLWLELYDLTKKHKVEFIKVKGHSDNELNNRCDELARAETQKIMETRK